MGVKSASAAAHARDSLGQASLVLGWLPVAALVALAHLAPAIPSTYRYLPLVASAVVFGMPHGAVDYVALPRARTGQVSFRGVLDVCLLYLLLGTAYLAMWLLVPVLAAALFILLTWFHWGQGEVYALRDLMGVDHVDDGVQQALTLVVRGGLPMLVPLLAFPSRYREVLETFVTHFGGTTGSWWLFETGPRVALAAAFGVITIVALARGWMRASDRRGWWLDAIECGLLWVYFLTVPPVLAVGVYFCLWHSVRHIARVVLLDSAAVDALASGRWGWTGGKFALEAAVPTVLALALVGGLWWATATTASTLAGATGLYLVAIAVLTLPHTVVVLGLDYQQHVWVWP